MGRDGVYATVPLGVTTCFCACLGARGSEGLRALCSKQWAVARGWYVTGTFAHGGWGRTRVLIWGVVLHLLVCFGGVSMVGENTWRSPRKCSGIQKGNAQENYFPWSRYVVLGREKMRYFITDRRIKWHCVLGHF